MKWFLDSKTIQTNAIFLAIVGYETYAPFIRTVLGERGHAIFMITMILINFWLRSITTKPITIDKGKADASRT